MATPSDSSGTVPTPPSVSPGATGAAPAGPGAPMPPPMMPYPSPAAPRRSRAPIYAAIAVVVIVVVLILALALVGVFPWFKGGGSGNGGSTAFGTARSQAQAVANNYQGGGWTLLLALGAAPTGNVSVPANLSFSGLGSTGCAYTSLGADTLNVAGTSDVSGGVAAAWIFLFRNSAGSGLIVGDVGGSASLMGSLSGSACSTAFSFLSPVPTTVIDSTTAAASANGAGGSAYLSSHPNANATFVLTGGASFLGISVLPQAWNVSYTGCSLAYPTTGPATSTAFYATVNATSGAVIASGTVTVSCGPGAPGGGGTTPVQGGLALGTPTSGTEGSAYFYNFSVVYADGTLTYGDLSFGLQTAAGAAIPPPAGSTLEVLDLGGNPIATYSFASGWTSGSATVASPSQVVSLITSASLSGDVFVVTGVGAYSGTMDVSIP